MRRRNVVFVVFLRASSIVPVLVLVVHFRTSSKKSAAEELLPFFDWSNELGECL
jgi:hypothetical protein